MWAAAPAPGERRIPDCVAHPGHYESEIDWLIEDLGSWDDIVKRDGMGHGGYDLFQHFLYLEMGVALNLLQVGRTEAAAARMNNALQDARRLGSEHWDVDPEKFHFWLAAVETEFMPVFEQVRAHPGAACPLQAISRDEEPEWHRRVDTYFKRLYDSRK